MDLFANLKSEVIRFVSEAPSNSLPSGESIFDEPFVGSSDGDALFFMSLKKVIGPFHWHPREALGIAGFPDPGSSISVFCWVLPLSLAVRKSNREETQLPSFEWAWARTHGEAVNVSLRNHMVNWLMDKGIPATSPQMLNEWRQMNDPSVGIASSWSERHASFAAGLGTFSLNDGLITDRGIAHRLGSLILAAPLHITSVETRGIREFCLFTAKGTCGACIRRCPVGAITADGHDKSICMEHVYGTSKREVGERFGLPQTGCGLCQTAVPCESRNPCKPSGE